MYEDSNSKITLLNGTLYFSDPSANLSGNSIQYQEPVWDWEDVSSKLQDSRYPETDVDKDLGFGTPFTTFLSDRQVPYLLSTAVSQNGSCNSQVLFMSRLTDIEETNGW